MSIRRQPPFLTLVLAVGALTPLIAAPASAASEGGAAEIAKAGKHKPKKCKKRKVPVTINGRRRCLPPKAALPKPKAADQRLLAAQAALRFNPGSIRDRRGRRAVSVAKLLGQKKTATAEKAIKQGLATVDRLRLRQALSSIALAPWAAASAQGCGAGPPGHPELTQSYGGSGFDAKVELDKGTAQIGVDLGEGGVRAEIDFGLCELGGDKFKVPDCPDAQGELEASDETLFFVNMRVFKGAELLLSQTFNFNGDTQIKPIQVDDDAKLEYFEIDHQYRTTIELGGSSQAFGRVSFKMNYHGSARVTFPGGSYDPTHTDVEVKVSIEGAQADELHELRDIEFDESLKAKREADKNFAAEVDKAIAKITDKEKIWQQPNKCAEITFNPAKGTLTLKKDQSGTFQAQLKAKRGGGSPPSAKWTRLDVQNATVGPASALANPTTFTYRVLDVGNGIEVIANFKAVSRAGVAEEKWIQKTKDIKSIEHIEGSFGGEMSAETSTGVPSKQSWNGSVSFDRFGPAQFEGASGIYLLSSGKAVISASGTEQTSLTGCLQSGSTEATFSSGSMQVEGTGPEQGPPYTYSVHVSMPLTNIEITRHSCPPGASEYEGTSGEVGAAWQFDSGSESNYESADGTSYADSRKEAFGGTSFEQFWTLQGKP